jgi:DNA-binding response OmpR family regulator
VLLGVKDTRTSAALSEAIRAEGIRAKFFSNIDEALTLIANGRRPSLAILEHDPPRINGMDMCRAIRLAANDDEHRLPVVMVAGQEDQDSSGVGVTDWLIKPFTGAYARTKIRAWVLRTACQSIRGGFPADEERPLAPLATLDTEREDRFDRIPRLASRPQKGTERKRSSDRVISSDKSSLLWMYSREIAPFETPTFSHKVGEIIARATSAPQKRAAGQRGIRPPRGSN